jgi:hypothetical protein
MALNILSVAPLYQGPAIHGIRVRTEAPLTLAKPLTPLAPSKSKLTTIEAKRIMSVLDEAIYKVELVTLMSYVESHPEALEGILQEDIMSVMKEHMDLCQVLLENVDALQEEEMRLRQEEDAEERWYQDRHLSIQLHKANLQPLMQEVQDSSKNVLRVLICDPRATKLLQVQAPGRSAEAQHFLQSLTELRGYLFEKLLTNPMEMKEKAQFIQDITRRNKQNQELIDSLENEVTARLKNRDTEVSLPSIHQGVEVWREPHGEAQTFWIVCLFFLR